MKESDKQYKPKQNRKPFTETQNSGSMTYLWVQFIGFLNSNVEVLECKNHNTLKEQHF